MRQVKYISYFNIYENVVFYLLKVGLSPSKNICVICLIESPLKMMKNSFHLILRALLVLKIFMFLLLIFGHVGKTAWLTSQPGLQAIAIHILPNISQSKGNQTMKFGQLIEYNKRNIFLQKLCRKWGRETSSRPLFIF